MLNSFFSKIRPSIVKIRIKFELRLHTRPSTAERQHLSFAFYYRQPDVRPPKQPGSVPACQAAGAAVRQPCMVVCFSHGSHETSSFLAAWQVRPLRRRHIGSIPASI